ncbi:fungal specific transcription factor domain-containing protein [Ophiocordyceps camponoti-floridani]|uniref:Fungal specific transcription factor domain-containing protein n=1 Tax=Ophiocordyceps camponoti-floridani TaxID=2030778 RepID=A0A8H4QCS6_9HYPO|nr:fungal specific transcription factor domain-containing protein [Ophiocordyceps camponoti-floridani]
MNGGDDAAAALGQGGGPHGRPRKFVIQSTFGNPRERRSRKNRPCDACRRRKTACVITSEPPCLFCQSRGIVCQSSPAASPASQQQDQQDQQTDQQQRQAHLHHQSRHALPPSSPQSTELPTPSTSSTHDSPEVMTSPFGRAAVVHQNLVGQTSPVAADDLEAAAVAAAGTSAAGAGGAGEPMPAAAPTGPTIGCTTLEDVSGWAAYYMGPTAEQDTFLLDAFRYGILSEGYNVDANIVRVHPGGSQPDDRPTHFLFLEVLHPDHVNRARQAASDAIEAKVWPYGERLVRLYFRHVHPVLPIVSKGRFLRRYHADKKGVPACLRGALYALASVFWVGTPCPFQQHELVDHAHAALRREIENPNLFVLQACLLLIHVTPPAIDCMEAPTTWTLAAQATACSQLIGLHQEPGQWTVEPVEKRLRRRLWWAVFVTDCWSSICHGSPPHVHAGSFNTGPPVMEDLRADELVPEDLRYLVEPPDVDFQVSSGARFLEMVNISRHLRTVLDPNFQVNTGTMTAEDRTQAQTNLVAVQAKLRDWPSLLPSCLVIKHEERRRSPVTSYNCPLHLSFYAAQVLLYRALMYPPTRAAKTTPGSNLRKWFPAALAEFESFAEFLTCINKHDLFGFWGRHARSHLILCGNFLIYLFLLAWERRDIERAYRLLESFHQTMHELHDYDNVQAKSLLRAATLRIDSFFTQAAQIMRQGGEGTVSSILNP